jgi:DHA1 family tetracycline resistance protein-like MFS transporter
MAIWGLYGPSAQSLMSRRVSESEQGQLQGALSSITGIANLVAPAIFSFIFAAALSTFKDWRMPGAPFLLAAALLVVAVGLAFVGTADDV